MLGFETVSLFIWWENNFLFNDSRLKNGLYEGNSYRIEGEKEQEKNWLDF